MAGVDDVLNSRYDDNDAVDIILIRFKSLGPLVAKTSAPVIWTMVKQFTLILK